MTVVTPVFNEPSPLLRSMAIAYLVRAYGPLGAEEFIDRPADSHWRNALSDARFAIVSTRAAVDFGAAEYMARARLNPANPTNRSLAHQVAWKALSDAIDLPVDVA
jgi:hypothetical protein